MPTRSVFQIVTMLLVLLAMPRPALSADVRAEGPKLIVSGQMFGQWEVDELIIRIGKDTSINTIVFKNFHIGRIGTHRLVAFAKFIREKKLSTEVDGSCSPACGLVFMGGVRRSVAETADPGKTYVAFRGSHYVTGKSVDSYRPTFVALLRRFSDGKMPEPVAQLAYSMTVDDFLVFIDGRKVKREDKISALQCKDVRRAGWMRRCSGLKDIDSHKVGVFTH